MKVFVDTNVWLAGRFRPGLCAELLETLVELDVAILLDERVFEEFRRIARDPKNATQRAQGGLFVIPRSLRSASLRSG